MTKIAEFKECRTMILKNAIYNRILTAVLSGKSQFCVASIVRRMRYETKEELRKKNDKIELWNYLLYDVIVEIVENHYWIGIKYKNFPIIWEYTNLYQENFKSLAEFIFARYDVNSCKLDKIFSIKSDDVKHFFKANSYSPRFWQVGLAQQMLSTEVDNFDSEKIDEYLEALKKRNAEYRAFNNILIKLLKSNIFILNNKTTMLLVQKSLNPEELYLKFNHESETVYDDFYPISTFTPAKWDTSEVYVTLFN